MPSMCEKVRTQKKSVSPSYTQRVYVYSKHTCRCKIREAEVHQRGAAYLSLHSPRIPPHTVTSYTLTRTYYRIHFSFFQLLKTNSKRSRGQCRFENADHVISNWGEGGGGGLGRCRLKHSCRSTFDLTRFLLMTPYCACPSQKWGGSSGKNKNLFCRRRAF